MKQTTMADPVTTYRGESMVSVLAQIREELGPDAVIVRQREGLVGGIGGFFQKRCYEVDARPGGLGIDVYDEEPQDEGGRAGGSSAGPAAAGDPPPLPVAEASSGAVPPTAPPADDPPTVARDSGLVRNDAATREGLATPAVQRLVRQAEPFAEMLGDLEEVGIEEPRFEPEAATEVAAEPEAPSVPSGSEAPVRSAAPAEPRRIASLREGMVAAGLGEDIAREVVDSVVAGAMPFASPGRLRTMVRNELALRIPVAGAAAPGPRTIVMVGPAGAGKTSAIEAIAAAHSAQGAPVVRLELDSMPRRYTAPAEGLLLVDTPPLWGGAEQLGELARRLRSLADPEVHLAIRAGIAAPAAAEVLDGLAALRPNRLLLTGSGETSHLGGVLDAAIRAGLPLGYTAAAPGQIALADPRELASRVTP